MKHGTKLLALFLIFVMMLAAAACTTNNQRPNDGTTTTPAPTSTPDTDPVSDDPKDRLSASDGIEAVNFNGQKYKISVYFARAYEIFSEDLTEVVSQAIFNRNSRVEEKYSIEIVPVFSSGGQLVHEQDIEASILAGDHDFDTVLMCAWRAGTLIVKNLFYNWHNNVPGVNFEQPWWNQRCNDAFTIDGMLFAAVGDTSITTLELAQAYMFNKSMAADKQIGDLYQVVHDGTWTIDYVKRISQNIYTDVNRDGTRDKEDVYGFASGVVTNLDAYLPSFGISLVSAESDGELVVSIDEDRDRVQTAVERVSSLFYDSEGSYISMTDAEYFDRYSMFANGQVFLTDGTVSVIIDYFRNMTDDYGVLPYPKLDEAQSDYYNHAHDNFSVFCMANNVENLEMVGKVTESLTCESYRTVVTAYYETALKDKFTYSQEDEDMLDIIMAGRNYDLAVLFAPTLDRLFYFFREEVRYHSTNVSKDLDAKMLSWSASLIRLQDIYSDMAANR